MVGQQNFDARGGAGGVHPPIEGGGEGFPPCWGVAPPPLYSDTRIACKEHSYTLIQSGHDHKVNVQGQKPPFPPTLKIKMIFGKIC